MCISKFRGNDGASSVSGALQSASMSVSPSADSGVYEGSETTVTATMSAPLDANVEIPLTLSNGTAEDGDHETLESITITAGQTTGNGKIATTRDADADAFTVALDSGNLPSSVTAGSASSVSITIQEVPAPDTVSQPTVTHNGDSLSVQWPAAALATMYDVTYYGNGLNARGAWGHADTSLTISCDSRPDYQNHNCASGSHAYNVYNVGVRAGTPADTSVGSTRRGRSGRRRSR